MARAGLDKHRKFLRLAQGLNPILPGMGAVLARGALETLWSAAYERADDYLGDVDDVEAAARWCGERGFLARLLADAGGDGVGFIEEDARRGGFAIHSFWEHAPPWVKVKSDKARARELAGKSISDIRRDAGAASRFKPKTDSPRQEVRQTIDSLPGMSTAKNSPGTGRDGTGREKEKIPAGGQAAADPLPLFANVDGMSLAEPPRCGEGRPEPGMSTSDTGQTRSEKQRRKRRADESAPLPFTIRDVCDVLRPAVLVDPFPTEKRITARLTALIRAVPDLDDWRTIADWLTRGGDGWTGGAKEGRPTLTTLVSHFDDWRAKATAAKPRPAKDPLDGMTDDEKTRHVLATEFPPFLLDMATAYMAQYNLPSLRDPC